MPEDRAERGATGIDPNGKVMFIVTENYPVALAEFAKILKGEVCYDALILNSGDSVQLHAKVGDFKLNIGGSGHAADGIGVFISQAYAREAEAVSV